MRRSLVLGLAAALSALLASPARADVLLLKDGRILERPKMERAEGGVKVAFQNGDVLVPDALIQDAVLTGDGAWKPVTPEEQAKAAEGLVPFEGKWVKPEKREELVRKRIAERAARIEEIKAHSRWKDRWKEKTKHFEFEYTVSPHVFGYYRDLMEAYFEEFGKTWKVKQPKDLGRLVVCFYTDEREFWRTGGVSPGVLGYFRFVKPLELNFFYDRVDPAGTEQVMYHETNHYLQLLLNPAFNMPHFPGEALAEYYGASRYDPATKQIESGLVLESRLAEIQTDVLAGDMMGLEKMVTTDGMYEHYTWGWSLAHYLMNDKRYRPKFEGFVKDLANGKGVRRESSGAGMSTVPVAEVWAQFQQALGLKGPDDVKALEEAWHAYVKGELKMVTPRGLEEAATRAMNLGLKIKAKRLFKEAIEKGTDRPLTFHAYGTLLERDGSTDEALPWFRKAVEMAPLEASFYGSLGEALLRKGEKDEGKRMLQLALELDPDNPWLASEVEEASKEPGS